MIVRDSAPSRRSPPVAASGSGVSASPAAKVATEPGPADDRATPPGSDDLPVAECWRLLDSGRALSAAEAVELELKLQRDPVDLRTRLRLLGRPHGDTLSPAAFELLAGLIEHHPASPMAGRISLMLPAFDSRSVKIIELWQRQIAAHPGQVRVLGNAAIWLQHYSWLQPDYTGPCKALFTRACTLEPDNPVWLDHLGLACLFEAGGSLNRHPVLARKLRKRRRADAAKSAANFRALAQRLREEQGLDGDSPSSENHYTQIAELVCWRARRPTSAPAKAAAKMTRILS